MSLFDEKTEENGFLKETGSHWTKGYDYHIARWRKHQDLKGIGNSFWVGLDYMIWLVGWLWLIMIHLTWVGMIVFFNISMDLDGLLIMVGSIILGWYS